MGFNRINKKIKMENLKYIFQQINDWLRFAEAKNLALLVFNSGVLIGVMSISDKIITSVNWLAQFFSLVLFVANLISVLIVFYSIYAKTKNLYKLDKSYDSNDNLFFFGDIARYRPDEYIKGLITKHNLKIDDLEMLKAKDLAHQIAINANITLFKFNCFNKALIFTASGIGVSGFVFAIIFIIKFIKYYA